MLCFKVPVTSQCLPGETGENRETPQLRFLVIHPRFKPAPSEFSAYCCTNLLGMGFVPQLSTFKTPHLARANASG
jgi:hypothetical protein